MISTTIRLPGSLDGGLATHSCAKCGEKRQRNDGVEMGGRFLCGSCWRFQAIRRKVTKKK